jgi:hypothetical protein
MSRQVNVFERGTTRAGDERPHLVGRPGYFDDVDAPQGTGTQKLLSGMEVETIVVINDSGGTLAPGAVATWKAGFAGTKVGGVTAAGAKGAGVVDPFLTAAVPNGRQFHLVVKGPTTVNAHGSGVQAGLRLTTQAAGRANNLADNGDADDAIAHFGTALENAAAQDNKVRAVVDFRL